MKFSEPWWRTDEYTDATPTGPLDIFDADLFGPEGAAMVRLYDNGTTDSGWGLTERGGEGPGFMRRYKRGDFNPRKILYGYNKGRHGYAWVMRGSRMVVLDIDGKNGGFNFAGRLGHLSPTLAETSKSGNGYHLFYLLDDEWDEDEGFALLSDHINVEQGVDFRGTGCVYHYEAQRWNNRAPAPLPATLKERLTEKTIRRNHARTMIQKTLELDEWEITIMHDELLTELAKPIPTGGRNNTLFAIGSKLKEAKVEGWEDALRDRATQVGLDEDEADKLVENIYKYV